MRPVILALAGLISASAAREHVGNKLRSDATTGVLNVDLMAGSSFAVNCPKLTDGMGVACAGPNVEVRDGLCSAKGDGVPGCSGPQVEVVDGQCVPKQRAMTKELIAAYVDEVVAEKMQNLTALESSLKQMGAQLQTSITPLETRITPLETQLATLSNSVNGLAMNAATMLTQFNDVKTTVGKLGKLSPTKVWETTVAVTNQDLRSIFDKARESGDVAPHVYRCLFKTSNGAHWKGAFFTIIVNYYLHADNVNSGPTHPNFPHVVYDVTELDAGAGGGCSAGWGGLSVSGGPSSNHDTATFSFAPGNCFQNLQLHCRNAVGF